MPSLPPFGFRSDHRIASSAISFRLPSASISAAASTDSPLPSAFASGGSGPSIQRLSPLPFRFLTSAVSAFFRPLQFWILTTQPLLFLSFSSRFRLAAASPVPASALASAVSPFSPVCLHAFLPGSRTRLRCSFPFALPCFAPTAVPQVLALRHFHFRLAFFRPLAFRFRLLSLLLFPFRLFPASPRSCFPGARFRSRFLGFPFLPGLISHAFLPGSRTRLFCWFPFALP